MKGPIDRQAFELLAEVIARPETERSGFLESKCGPDRVLLAAVESLLKEHDALGTFLEVPIVRLNGDASSGWPDGNEATTGDRQSADPWIGTHVGGFRLERLIGEGGMGMVFEASQENPRRTVAVKVLRSASATTNGIRRFIDEAQILARLRHPGIAQVYAAGMYTPDGSATRPVPYFVMEHIPDARTIVEHCRERNLDVRARLELFQLVCDAMHHAHQNAVIHRDLKPGNILVDATGRPRVIDFGVARVAEANDTRTARTLAGQLIGTLQYMAPEQCLGSSAVPNVRADVFSLGAVLYELLCGRPPHDTADLPLPDALRRVAEAPIARPSSLNPAIRGDIETVVLHALARDPARRYQAVSDLAADIGRCVRREPILARPPTAWYQAGLFVRRHTVGVSIGVVALLTLLVAATSVAVLYVHAEQQRAIAVDAVEGQEIGEKLVQWLTPYMMESLSPEERALTGARSIICVRPVKSQKMMLALVDDTSTVLKRLVAHLSIPPSLNPVNDAPLPFEVTAALVADVLPDHPGRELVVTLHCAGEGATYPDVWVNVLRVYDLNMAPLDRDLWNMGHLSGLAWDGKNLIVSGNSYLLQRYVPDLAADDSLGCPNLRLNTPFIASIAPARLGGVLFPGTPDTPPPFAEVNWMKARAPDEVARGDRSGLSARLSSVVPSAVKGGAFALVVELIRGGDDDDNPVVIAEVDSHGVVVSDFREPQSGNPVEVSKYPLRVIDVPVGDLGPVIRAAEQAADQSDSIEDAEVLLKREFSLSGQALDAALSEVRAMRANWRWLEHHAGRIVEDATRDRDRDRLALAWAEEAVRLHEQRCPDLLKCPCYFPRQARGLAHFRLGDYQRAIVDLAVSKADTRPLSAACLSICQYWLGDLAARTTLSNAVQLRDALATQVDTEGLARIDAAIGEAKHLIERP